MGDPGNNYRNASQFYHYVCARNWGLDSQMKYQYNMFLRSKTTHTAGMPMGRINDDYITHPPTRLRQVFLLVQNWMEVVRAWRERRVGDRRLDRFYANQRKGEMR
jgi:hypothetical protein